MCQGLNSWYWGWSSPPLIGNPYSGYINPDYWVDDHPLLYGKNESLDPSTYEPWPGQYRLTSTPQNHGCFAVPSRVGSSTNNSAQGEAPEDALDASGYSILKSWCCFDIFCDLHVHDIHYIYHIYRYFVQICSLCTVHILFFCFRKWTNPGDVQLKLSKPFGTSLSFPSPGEDWGWWNSSSDGET